MLPERGIPDFWCPFFGHKTWFRARMREIKSGIPCSACCATIFWNHLTKLLQKFGASQKTNTSHAIIFCNLLANFMLPKRRFWMAERTFGIEFSNYFSKERGPNRVLTPLKSTSKMRSWTFVGLPKSSFGEHKLVTKDSINRNGASHAIIFCNHLEKLVTKDH